MAGHTANADRRGSALPWAAITILTALNVLSYMDRQLLALLALPIQATTGISDVQLGLLQGFAFSITFTLASLPIGWAVDHFSRGRIIFGGVIVWSLATMASGLSRTFASLFLCRIVVGVGEATLAPSAYAILVEQTPRGRLATATGIYAIGASIGMAAALIGGGLAIGAIESAARTATGLNALASWQWTFILLGLPGLALAFTALLLPSKPAARVVEPSPAGNRDFLRYVAAQRWAYLPQQLGFAMLGLAGYAVVGWAPAHLGRVFGWTPVTIGPALGLAVGLAGLLGTLVASAAADRRFRAGHLSAYFDTPIVSTIIGAPLIVGAFVAPDAWTCIGLLAVGYFFMCSFGGSCTAALQLMTPAAFRGRASALYVFTLNVLGLGLGPLVVGMLTQYVFEDPAMVGSAIAVTVAAAAAVSLACLLTGRRAHGTLVGALERTQAAA